MALAKDQPIRSHLGTNFLGSMAFWRWVLSGDSQGVLLSVDADVVPPDTLQHAKSLAIGLLNLESAVDKYLDAFPHGQYGGWPAVDPMSDLVTYAHVPTDDGGIPAMSMGSSVKQRSRGVALALVMSAAIVRPDKLTEAMVRDAHDGLSHWIADAKREYDKLRHDAQTLGSERRRSRSRSVYVAVRGRPSFESELGAMKKDPCNAELAVEEARDELKRARLSNAALARENKDLHLQLQRGSSSEAESDAWKKKLRNAELEVKEARRDLKRERLSNATLVRENEELRLELQRAEGRITKLEKTQARAEPRGSSTAEKSHKVRRKHGHGRDDSR